jgi:signal transduction histidine kinase
LAALGADALGADALGAEPHADTRQPGPGTRESEAGLLTIERVEAEAATVLLAIFNTPRPPGPSASHEPSPTDRGMAAATGRRAPLRFVWQMDAELRFTVGSDAFVALMGPATAASLGRPWPELAAELALDPEGQIALAVASRDTWSGLCIAWPAGDGRAPLMVELSGLPVFDRERSFRGYRGFGICRDAGRLAWPGPPPAGAAAAMAVAENVVPLRPTSQPIAPALSPVERSAFHELTRKLHERLTATTAAPSLPDPDLHSNLAPAQEFPPVSPPGSPPEQTPYEVARAVSTPDPRLELARAQAELAAAKRQAEKTAAAKSDFLAKISHEIRTPLNAIIGFSEIMAQEKFGPVGNERYRQYLLDIQSSGAHLLALVNDLLDLSKIEAGRLELDFASVALNPLTQQCVALLAPHANRERIIIRTSLSEKLPPVIADARSVRQIVLNLISNSTKFTGAGGQVIVSTTLTDLGEVVLRVRDSGAGMSEREIALALEPFRQVAATVRSGPGGAGPAGTGLGLPLTKALAEANRATFSITSAPNAGTLIEVAFPPARVMAEAGR